MGSTHPAKGRGSATAGNDLTDNMDRIHTTAMGEKRIRGNLGLGGTDAAAWCRERILDGNAVMERRGKNWYVHADGCVITVNAGSYTIITAHRERTGRKKERTE